MLDLLPLHRQADSIGGDESQPSPTWRWTGRATVPYLGSDDVLARHLLRLIESQSVIGGSATKRPSALGAEN
jgi:hypothetical protein